MSTKDVKLAVILGFLTAVMFAVLIICDVDSPTQPQDHETAIKESLR